MFQNTYVLNANSYDVRSLYKCGLEGCYKPLKLVAIMVSNHLMKGFWIFTFFLQGRKKRIRMPTGFLHTIIALELIIKLWSRLSLVGSMFAWVLARGNRLSANFLQKLWEQIKLSRNVPQKNLSFRSRL